VPDPYYDGEAFERVFEILDVCCRNLLAELDGALRP
jgi:protein-tyrosine-phosphatase